MILKDLQPSVRWALEEVLKLITSGENGEVTIVFGQGGVKDLRDARTRRPPRDT